VDRLFSELYQPLDYKGFFFAAASATYFESEVDGLSPEGELERVRLDFSSVAADLGVQFRNVGQLRFGVVRGSGKADVLTQSDIDRIDFEIGALQTNLVIDRFDNANFPRAGGALQTGLTLSRESLGADQNYDRLTFYAGSAHSRAKNTILAFLDGASNLGTDLPFYENVDLGGFLNLSGLDPGEVSGNLGGVVAALYYRQIARMAPTLGKDVYLGGSIEAGGAWESSSEVTASELTWAGSIFVGADTRFGPLYLGYGRAEGGEDAFYFFLGQLFTAR
jgi:NTE family protein